LWSGWLSFFAPDCALFALFGFFIVVIVHVLAALTNLFFLSFYLSYILSFCHSISCWLLVVAWSLCLFDFSVLGSSFVQAHSLASAVLPFLSIGLGSAPIPRRRP
jgi:hypothetical protein